MTTDTITPTTRLSVVKHLASGKSPEIVATITRLDRSAVIDIGSNHGYPDTGKLAWAADVLAKKIDQEQNAIPVGEPPRTPVAATSTPAATGQARPMTKSDEIRVLLNTAKAHPAKRIQNAADRVFDSLDRLRALIREDEEKNSEKRKETEAKAAARAEVARLEQALKDAKARLRGKPVTNDDSTPKANTAPKGVHPCRNEGCDRVFDTGQGRSLHERMKCEHRVDEPA